MEQKQQLGFERLEVYQKALDYIDTIFNISKGFPRHLQSSLGDQLRRSALSIANNIAEGSDKISSKERKLFYRYALDSARECIPMLTIAERQGLIVNGTLRENCLTICRMMRRLSDSVQ